MLLVFCVNSVSAQKSKSTGNFTSFMLSPEKKGILSAYCIVSSVSIVVESKMQFSV